MQSKGKIAGQTMDTNSSEHSSSVVQNLRLSRLSPPYLGIGTPRPSLSWATWSSRSNWIQSAYQVSVTIIPTKINTSQVSYVSSHIWTRDSLNQPWPEDFPSLVPRQRVTVSVRVWASDTEAADSVIKPSGWAHLPVEAGLLTDLDWRGASLITTWDGIEIWDTPQPVPLFRKSFELSSGKATRGRIYATALGIYKIFIDGVPIGDSIMEPGWTTYQRRQLYQTYDVTESLTGKKKIEIAVFVADGWYRGRLVSGGLARRGYFGKETALLLCMDVDYEDGSSTTLVTDDSWFYAIESPIISTEIYDGEVHDARIKPDPRDEKEWLPVKVLPPLGDEIKLEASTAPPVRHTETFKYIKQLKSPEKKVILDFGQNLVGRLHITATAKPGAEVTFIHAEVLEKDGSVATRPLRDAKATDRYIFNGYGEEEWEPAFTFHGFRYVQVDPWIEGMEIEAKVYGSDCEKGLVKFESDHNGLNHLIENVRWSTKGNFFSIPTDCPQRDERLGWTGDIQVFAPTATFIFDCQSFLSSWLRDLIFSTSMHAQSIPPLVCPDVLWRNPNAVWQDVIFTLPYVLYTTYGDVSVLHEAYPTMKKYFEKGIPKKENGTWADTQQFGDWLDPDCPPDRPDQSKTAAILVANAYLAHCSSVISKVAKVIGKEHDAEHYATHAEYLRSQFVALYVLPTNDFRLSSDTQTAYSLAINFELLPRHLHAHAVNRLHELMVESNYHLNTGFAGTPELLHAIGDPALAYKVLLEPQDAPSWLYPVNMGATTIWERWDSMLPDGSVNPGTMTSFNHYAYGAVGRWVFENVGGIAMNTEKNEGWRHIIFQPVPSPEHGVTKCEIAFSSPYGRIECAWNLDVENGKFDVEVVVPASCEAELRMPKGCKTTASGTEAVWKFGSGSRHFDCNYVAEAEEADKEWLVVQRGDGRRRRCEEVDYSEVLR